MKPIQKQCLPALHKIYKDIRETAPNLLSSNIFDDELAKRAGTLLDYSLAKEQGFVCCYCMRRIEQRESKDGEIIRGKISKEGKTENLTEDEALPLYDCKIEHFKPRSIYDGTQNKPDLRIDYNNLLCACTGDADPSKHCDTLKGNSELIHLPNPADVKTKDFERLFQLKYTENGIIKSDNPDIHTEIGGEIDTTRSTDNLTIYKKGILNLNASELIELRKCAWKIVTQKITARVGPNWNANEKKLKPIVKYFWDMYQEKTNDQYIPFYGCVLYLLKNRFKKFLT